MTQQTLKNSATTGLGVPPHGFGGLFNNPGVEPGIVSTLILPDGIEAYLTRAGHVFKSQYENPVYGIMTGQTDNSGTNPTTGCSEDAITPGSLKMCHQTWPFGEFTLKSKPIQIDRSGSLINRSEPLDLRLLNNPFGNVEQPIQNNPAELFRSRLAKELVETTVGMTREFAREIWTGSPVNTIGNTGGYQQYNGLERIVNTGYKDVFTGVACSAADSLVETWSGGTVQAQPAKILRTLVEAFRSRRKLESDVGLTGTSYAFVMRYQAFLSLTEVWPCAYNTFRCYTPTPDGNAIVLGNASDNVAMRDAMRQGRYLLIDGEQVPVIIDTTLSEANIGNGNFSSDVYLLPLRSPYLGDTNGAALFIEHFDYNGPYGMGSILPELGPRDEYRVTPDGRFAIFFLGGASFCKQVLIRTRKRVILRLPFLAYRLNDLTYSVYVHEREWEPGTSFYENGGQTSFAGTSFYSPV